MKIQLEVTKADGTVERYLHTKVVGTINNSLDTIGQPDIGVAEELAEVVTYFLYDNKRRRRVTSGEILAVVKAVLSATGCEQAAIALSEHHVERRLRRARIEVLSVAIHDLTDAEQLLGGNQRPLGSRWNKTRIVEDLVAEHGLSRQTARTVASMVEERVFNVGLTRVPVSLIKQLVLGDTAAVVRAQQELQII